MTDESNTYVNLDKYFAKHGVVDHSRKEYAYTDRVSGIGSEQDSVAEVAVRRPDIGIGYAANHRAHVGCGAQTVPVIRGFDVGELRDELRGALVNVIDDGDVHGAVETGVFHGTTRDHTSRFALQDIGVTAAHDGLQ